MAAPPRRAPPARREPRATSTGGVPAPPGRRGRRPATRRRSAPRTGRRRASGRLPGASGGVEHPVEGEHRHVLVVDDLVRRGGGAPPPPLSRLLGSGPELLGRLPESRPHVVVVTLVEGLPPPGA